MKNDSPPHYTRYNHMLVKVKGTSLICHLYPTSVVSNASERYIQPRTPTFDGCIFVQELKEFRRSGHQPGYRVGGISF